MNELVIGYESALDFWRAARVAATGPEEKYGPVIGALQPTLAERARRAIAICGTEAPLDVVAPNAQARRNCALITNRLYDGPIGSKNLHGIGDSMYVCSLPVVFVQVARQMDEIDLALLACELCGTYGLTSFGHDACEFDLAPCTNLSDLRVYAQSAHALGIKGAARAKRALKLACAGSASPRESEIAVAFALSRRKGGAQLGGFVMNSAIKLSREHARLVDSSTIRPDFLWPEAHLVVEYDSNEFHLTSLQRDKDEARRQVLENLGYTVKTLTNDMLLDNARFNAFVATLEELLGVRRRPLTELGEKAREALRERLFGTESARAIRASRRME